MFKEFFKVGYIASILKLCLKTINDVVCVYYT